MYEKIHRAKGLIVQQPGPGGGPLQDPDPTPGLDNPVDNDNDMHA